MSFRDMLGKVDMWAPDRVRSCLEQRHPDDIQLVDVRSLQEFAQLHLPGALHVPAEDLPQRMEELIKGKLTIVCCAQGTLSRAVAQMLLREGFSDVHVLKGGMHAWQWGTSTGLPEEFAEPFLGGDSATDQALLAWHVEETTRQFYQAMAQTIREPQVAKLFAELVDAESRHMATLRALWEGLSGQVAAADFPAGLTAAETAGRLEGGRQLEDVLAWAARSTPAMIVDLAMALEFSAYDQYLFLSRHAKDPDSRRLFEVMAVEERHHLKSFGSVLASLAHSA